MMISHLYDFWNKNKNDTMGAIMHSESGFTESCKLSSSDDYHDGLLVPIIIEIILFPVSRC